MVESQSSSTDYKDLKYQVRHPVAYNFRLDLGITLQLSVCQMCCLNLAILLRRLTMGFMLNN